MNLQITYKKKYSSEKFKVVFQTSDYEKIWRRRLLDKSNKEGKDAELDMRSQKTLGLDMSKLCATMNPLTESSI